MKTAYRMTIKAAIHRAMDEWAGNTDLNEADRPSVLAFADSTRQLTQWLVEEARDEWATARNINPEDLK